ncbi:DUF551 domain-containing protein [Sporomusa sphaeroides]|uniref:DUF551 domain-containing protein n=1 Tax=Sporomusa sphaeroides TaxID=47679 RepID=UPI003D7C28D0
MSERLPEEDDHYWGLDNIRGWQCKAEWKRGKWTALSNEPYSTLVAITHWMPLPPSPNKE